MNAIDEMLSGSDQTTESWSLNRLPILQLILAEAEVANRVVILTSDHGHAIDYGTTRIRQTDASERWREGTPESDTEVAISGPRVLTGKPTVALATDRARYSAKSHNGYHGGLTPQECIVPLLVLAQSGMPGENWTEAPSADPIWWNVTGAVSTRASIKSKSKKAQPTLFEQHRHWIEDLLDSDLFKTQIELTAGRVKRDQVAKILRVLDAAPGRRLLKQAFATQTQISTLRVSTTVAVIQRVLNIDGYPILTLDESSGYLAFDEALLLKQFGLS